VSWTVTGSNDAPSVVIDSDTATANQVAERAVAGTYTGLTASAHDSDGSAVTYSIVGDTSGGGFQVAPDGRVLVLDGIKLDFESLGADKTHSVTVRASDGVSFKDTQFTIGITDGAEPNVLFVDDDAGVSSDAAWTQALKALGYDVTYEAIAVNGDPVHDLIDYDIVIWSVSDRAYSNLTAENVQTLTSYLNQGGNLLYAGGHNVYEEPAASSFIADQLGLSTFNHNMPYLGGNGSVAASGAGGTYTLGDMSDSGLTSHYGGTMISAFDTSAPTATKLMDITNGSSANDIAAINITSDYRAATWSFDLSQLDANYRLEFLGDTLRLLEGQDPAVIFNG
jgi:hypothetical protein